VCTTLELQHTKLSRLVLVVCIYGCWRQSQPKGNLRQAVKGFPVMAWSSDLEGQVLGGLQVNTRDVEQLLSVLCNGHEGMSRARCILYTF
jgi:hypothetical protein